MKHVLLLLFLLPSTMLTGQFSTSPRSQKAVETKTPLLRKEMHKQGYAPGDELFLRIFKTEKVLEVWVKKDNIFHLFKTYPVCAFSGGLGTKTKKGDQKAPEGFYTVLPKSLNPWSSYHLSFDTGYPNAYDRAQGYTGSAIMVHGDCVSIGCYAMTDEYIEEIYTLVQKAFERRQKSIALHIFPFRMTEENIKKQHDPTWNVFWNNLKTGYDYFEIHNIPPQVSVKNKQYNFK